MPYNYLTNVNGITVMHLSGVQYKKIAAGNQKGNMYYFELADYVVNDNIGPWVF